MPQIHPDTVTLTADVRSIPREYVEAAREWTGAIHEQDGTLKLAQVLAQLDTNRTATNAHQSTARRVYVDIRIELLVTDEELSAHGADDRLGAHIWELDPEESSVEIASVTRLNLWECPR
jgi:hypothetical protein